MASDGDSLNLGILKGELAALELRIVDRITGSLERKADRAQVETIEKDLEIIKTIGSPAVVLVQQNQKELTERIFAIEREQLSRQYLIPVVKETAADVESIKGWRNKVIGGFLLVSSVAIINFARIWFGI